MLPETDRDPLPTIRASIAEFILDRQVRRLSPRSIEWHTHCLAKFAAFCDESGIADVESVTPRIVRQYLQQLEADGHNAGGVNGLYRSLRTMLRWYADEYEPVGWDSPTNKIRVGRGDTEALDPIALTDFAKLIATCQRHTFAGERDRAILFVLLDTGVRRQELADLKVEDVDTASGAVMIRSGKGGKARIVYLGTTSRRAVTHYLRLRQSKTSALWVSADGTPLKNDAIHSLVRRRAKDAGISPPGLHSFRRAFAINYLRNGGDVLTLQRLLGHSTLDIINRYVKFASADIAQAHAAHGVVDRL